MTTAAPFPPLTLRNATLDDLVDVLRAQHARKIDVIVPAERLRAVGTHLELIGTEPLVTKDGVTATAGRYLPTAHCDQDIATKLGIPAQYLRRTREEQPRLYEANINGWLQADPRRRFLFRALAGNGRTGVGRALLSNSYKIVDNLDVLMAALAGITDSGVAVQIDGADLTERRMFLRVACEQIQAYAPDLVTGYRSPFSGADAAAHPVVFAGFLLANSETGDGAFTITPRLTLQVCRNGMTINRDVLREVHLGGRMDDGIVRWSPDTLAKSMALVTARARDAVRTFLDVDYVRAKIAELSRQARVEVAEPDQTIAFVATKLSFTKDQQQLILQHFIKGGALTAGGVMHAVTSAAQVLDDAEKAFELESRAVQAMHLAAAL
ncbi:Phage protein [[Actinomadura] parvosata subsp. kistnae]|uniref:DUF932 domain-containing protein n=1 Tax=[Actinomadura] parvosata TaxID=1955412 RepID=UPI000D2E3734|nr:DUF932 domain-containing protein [Nonomuraea sp. ATCC 55076]SPL98646.1 Phage protein [Actinomadura parvosata subsp. kistnae]